MVRSCVRAGKSNRPINYRLAAQVPADGMCRAKHRILEHPIAIGNAPCGSGMAKPQDPMEEAQWREEYSKVLAGLNYSDLHEERRAERSDNFRIRRHTTGIS